LPAKASHLASATSSVSSITNINKPSINLAAGTLATFFFDVLLFCHPDIFAFGFPFQLLTFVHHKCYPEVNFLLQARNDPLSFTSLYNARAMMTCATLYPFSAPSFAVRAFLIHE
jgi:hypothetical protein